MMELLLAMREEARSGHEASMKAWREEMAAMTCKWRTDNHKETIACQEMEASQEEEPTSLDRKPEAAEQQEVP